MSHEEVKGDSRRTPIANLIVDHGLQLDPK